MGLIAVRCSAHSIPVSFVCMGFVEPRHLSVYQLLEMLILVGNLPTVLPVSQCLEC